MGGNRQTLRSVQRITFTGTAGTNEPFWPVAHNVLVDERPTHPVGTRPALGASKIRPLRKLGLTRPSTCADRCVGAAGMSVSTEKVGPPPAITTYIRR